MATVGASVRSESTGSGDDLVARRAARRDALEAVGFLVGVLGVLAILAATIGAAGPG